MRKAIVASGIVENIIEIDETSDFQPGVGRESVDYADGCEIGGAWDGAVFHPVPPPPTPSPVGADVDRERDRRIAGSFTAATSGGRTIPVDTRNEKDFRNLNGLGAASLSRLVAGDATSFVFRGSNNVDYTLSPTEMHEVAMQALGHVDAHYKAGWAIKDMAEIPANYTDDSYWP